MEIATLSHFQTNRKVFDLVASEDLSAKRIVDIGGGEGYFCSILGEHIRKKYGLEPRRVLRSCDLYPEQFGYKEIDCDRIDAGSPLPYEDGSFDIVTCIEVVEHIEDQFRLIRELYRITRPGGRLIMTTPNVMNVNSRMRQLVSGFGVLFNPLPLASSDPVGLRGHIHPVSFYYLAFMCRVAGYRRVNVHFDKTKRSAVLWLPLFLPAILLGGMAYRSYARKKDRAVYEENRELLTHLNSFGMLTSRTLILEGVKS